MTDKEKIAELEKRVKELEKDNEASRFSKALEEFRKSLPPPSPVPFYYPRYWEYPHPQPYWITWGTGTNQCVSTTEARYGAEIKA